MIIIKSDREIECMAHAGHITAVALDAVAKYIKVGVSTYELDEIARDTIMSHNAKPAFLNYNGFPKSICVSVNDEIVHGIPSKKRILHDGDIVSIDIGAIFEGFVGDMANTYPVGNVSEQARALIEITRKSFYEGIKYCKKDCKLYDISAAVQACAEGAGYGVVREYVGHGIGRQMHEDPQVPNYGKPGSGPRLQKNMVLAIEPMINIGTWETVQMKDGWTVKTADGSLSAHYEHTVAVTNGEPRILTEL